MWWNRIFSDACSRLGLKFKPVYDAQGFDNNLQRFAQQQEIDFLSHGNADMAHISDLGEHRGVHIVRDPRDIAVSAYFSHLHSHSTKKWSDLEDYRQKLQGLSKDEGLAVEIENRQTEFRQIESWDYNQPNILEIKFEDMAQSSYDLVIRVFQHYGLIDESAYRMRHRLKELTFHIVDGIGRSAGRRLTRKLRPDTLSGAEILGIAWRHRFQSLAGGRKQGDENIKSHFRKGRPGDWVNHFTESHRALFKDLYPHVLEKLGYESSSEW
jgi:hypothetical protein